MHLACKYTHWSTKKWDIYQPQRSATNDDPNILFCLQTMTLFPENCEWNCRPVLGHQLLFAYEKDSNKLDCLTDSVSHYYHNRPLYSFQPNVHLWTTNGHNIFISVSGCDWFSWS